MFGKKKSDKLIENIDRYFDLMDQAVLVFRDGVRNYLYSNNSDFNENLKSMSALESDEIYIISHKNDINYLQAIKRVIGMYDKPLANE